MPRKYFPFFAAYYEAAQHLSAKDRAAFYEAVINYSFTAKEPALKGQSEMCWILVKPYLEKSMDDFLNGSKGGRPRKNQNPGLSENENPGFEITETPVSFSSQTKKKRKKEDKEENQQHSTAPSAACVPLKGTDGGMTVLGTANLKDGETEEARKRFLDSLKNPAWSAAQAAPPDIKKEV